MTRQDEILTEMLTKLEKHFEECRDCEIENFKSDTAPEPKQFYRGKLHAYSWAASDVHSLITEIARAYSPDYINAKATQ